MLRWQQVKVYNRYIVIAKIALLSFFLHAIGLIFLFFVYKQSRMHLELTVNSSLLHVNIPVMFMSTYDKSKSTFDKVLSQINSTGPVKLAPVKETALIASAPVQKKEIKQKETSLPDLKKNAPLLPDKKENKVPLKENTEIQAKKVPLLGQKIPVKAVTPVIKTNQMSSQKIDTNTLKGVSVNKEIKQIELNKYSESDPVHIKATPQEIILYRQQQQFQQELRSAWNPPVGIAKDKVCQITMHLDWNGKIKQLTIDVSSGILMYDTAARAALYTMKMPLWMQGKSLTISFRQ